MFCYQCEQTAKGSGCTVKGVCGKDPDVAALQDLIVYAVKGLSMAADAARRQGIVDDEVNRFTVKALFTTVTNVNFDAARFVPYIRKAVNLRNQLVKKLRNQSYPVEFPDGPATFQPADDLEGMIKQGYEHGIFDYGEVQKDIKSLQETTIYGIKGLAAYADHAQILGQEDDAVYEYIHRALAETQNPKLTLEDWVNLTLECGKINLRTMELLDAGNTGKYGHPVPTAVPLGVKKGRAIVVSGHDLRDLEEILKQTEGKGINVYTHGEMLPCHGYPELKKYSHFYGHYGTAWQNQAKEFDAFPGAIVMTTNCIQKPRDSYKDRIFTCGLVGWPDVAHIDGHDFSPAIEKALEMPGFTEDLPGKTVMVGFARNAVTSVAGKVIDLVKAGKLRHFFLVGGCDGAKPGRSYYTEFVEKVPDDCVVLTLACGKFRFFDKDLGDIEGIPRLLDVGQCNDAYSAIQIAQALSDAFNLNINELPLSMILSWYEQKAVAILLTLFHLGVKDIRLGPTLPAFVTPDVLQVLVDHFDVKPIDTPDNDLNTILAS